MSLFSRWFGANGTTEPVKRRGRQPGSTAQRNAEICRVAVDEGLTIQQLMERFSLAYHTIGDILRAANIKAVRPVRTTPDPRRRLPPNEVVIAAYEAGASVVTLGEEYGVSRERVCQILRPVRVIEKRQERNAIVRATIEEEADAIKQRALDELNQKKLRAIEIVRNGASHAEAVRQTGIPFNIIGPLCREAGLVNHHGRWRRDADFEARKIRATELRAQGKTWNEIYEITRAEGNPINYQWVIRYLPELMVKVQLKAPTQVAQPVDLEAMPRKNAAVLCDWTDDKKAEMVRMYFDGHTAKFIAETFGPPFTRNAILGMINRMRKAGKLKQGGA